jgi:hypothetical protein
MIFIYFKKYVAETGLLTSVNPLLLCCTAAMGQPRPSLLCAITVVTESSNMSFARFYNGLWTVVSKLYCSSECFDPRIISYVHKLFLY